MKRVVIIGNRGSGKTFLAQRMSAPTRAPVLNLDELPSGDSSGLPAEIDAFQQQEEWIVEGISGDLAELFLDRADYLIWLDLPWLTCREGLLLRGLAAPSQPDPVQAEENFHELFVQAENYWTRTDSRSYAGHQEIFDRFPKARDRIVHRGCAEALWDDD